MKIELPVNVAAIEYQLKRIADSLDLILLKQFNWTSQEIIDRRPRRGKGEESIEYSSDEALLKAEIKDLMEPLQEEDDVQPEGN